MKSFDDGHLMKSTEDLGSFRDGRMKLFQLLVQEFGIVGVSMSAA